MKDEKYDLLEYINNPNLTDEEREYAKNFYNEYYFDGISSTPENERIITTEEMTKEARRNHNSLKTDALFRAGADGNLHDLHENSAAFMEEASDEWEWQDAFKVGGFELALKLILDQTRKDLNNMNLDVDTVLLRYYEKRDRLRRMLNREKRKD